MMNAISLEVYNVASQIAYCVKHIPRNGEHIVLGSVFWNTSARRSRLWVRVVVYVICIAQYCLYLAVMASGVLIAEKT